jgi:hypothetical protein
MPGDNKLVSDKPSDEKHTFESADDYPLFSFSYMVSSPQTPSSDALNLTGLYSHFSAFQANLNYGWFLDKKKENTILLTSLGCAVFKTNLNVKNVDTPIPDYIKAIPNTHHFYFNLIYNQKLRHNWEISGSSSISLATDYSQKLTNKDYNVNILGYAQKKFKGLSLGCGYVTYLIGNNIKGLPIGYFSYENKKVKCEIIAPISASFKYKFRERNMLIFSNEFDFDGFSIDKGMINNQPDYIDITDFESGFSYDRAFLEKLHWNIGVGYFYREMTFLKENQKIDRLLFDQSLFLTTKIYCTF